MIEVLLTNIQGDLTYSVDLPQVPKTGEYFTIDGNTYRVTSKVPHYKIEDRYIESRCDSGEYFKQKIQEVSVEIEIQPWEF